MTTTASLPTAAGRAARPVPVARAFRFELVKQLAQWRIRLLIRRLLDPPGARPLRRRAMSRASV